jgi:hypothetical protein
MARQSLKSAVARKDAGEAAKKAAETVKKIKPANEPQGGSEELFETVSYNLPVELIDLVRELAEARVAQARKEQRQAKRRGEKGPEARRSASAVVREALEAHKAVIEAELNTLR